MPHDMRRLIYWARYSAYFDGDAEMREILRNKAFHADKIISRYRILLLSRKHKKTRAAISARRFACRSHNVAILPDGPSARFARDGLFRA